jgi:hypothetical protein
MYTVFNRLTAQLADGERPEFLEPIELLLDGKATEDVKEHGIGKTRVPSESLKWTANLKKTIVGTALVSLQWSGKGHRKGTPGTTRTWKE